MFFFVFDWDSGAIINQSTGIYSSSMWYVCVWCDFFPHLCLWHSNSIYCFGKRIFIDKCLIMVFFFDWRISKDPFVIDLNFFFKVSHLKKKNLFLHLSIDIINSTKDLKKRNSQMEITKTKQKKTSWFPKKNPFAFLQQQKDLSPGAFFWKKNIISNQTKLNIKKKEFSKVIALWIPAFPSGCLGHKL